MGDSNDSLAILVTLAICILAALAIFLTVITLFIAYLTTVEKSRHTWIQTQGGGRR